MKKLLIVTLLASLLLSSVACTVFLKYPSGKFVELDNKSMQFIIKNADKYAFMPILPYTAMRLRGVISV